MLSVLIGLCAGPLVIDATTVPFPVPKLPVQINQLWLIKGSSDGAHTLPVVALQVYAEPYKKDWLQLFANVRAGDHYDYRAVDDTVNTACRIQSLNKQFSTKILVT